MTIGGLFKYKEIMTLVKEKAVAKVKNKSTEGFRISVGSGPDDEQYQTINYNTLYTAYKLHPDVFACVQQWKSGVLSAGWSIVNKDEASPDDTSKKRLEDFFGKPNPNESLYELLSELIDHLGIAGDGYWNIVFNLAVTEPKELYGLHPVTMKVNGNKHGDVLGYTQEYNGEDVKFKQIEIAHFKLPNPLNDWYGLSPLYSCLWEVETDLAALWSNYHFFKNDATPPTIWSLPVGLSKPQYEDAKRVILNEFQGVKNKHRNAIVKGDVKVETVSQTFKDMEFEKGRRLATEKICAAYKVPKVLIGYTESANYNTSLTMERTFYQTTIQPLQLMIEYVINEQIIPLFGIDTCEFKFNPSDFNDRDITLKEVIEGVKLGIFSINEARSKLGDKALDEKEFKELGNIHFINTTGGMTNLADMFSGEEMAQKNILKSLINIKTELNSRIRNGCKDDNKMQ